MTIKYFDVEIPSATYQPNSEVKKEISVPAGLPYHTYVSAMSIGAVPTSHYTLYDIRCTPAYLLIRNVYSSALVTKLTIRVFYQEKQIS